MLLKLWRSSHLLLALISAVFFLLAAISGFLLAFEPIQHKIQVQNPRGTAAVSLADFMEGIIQEYESILEVEVLENQAIKISAIDADPEKDGDFIIDAKSTKKIGAVPAKSKFFQTLRNFHRSLFLKSTGRIMVGVCSFLFLLIIITGLLLLTKRDGGLKTLYKKTLKTNLTQYLHVLISKWTWIPLVIIAFTGVYLSLLRFEIIPELDLEAITLAEEVTPNTDKNNRFKALENYTIGDLKKIEFPFSEEASDPFIIALKDRKISINQYTGEVVEAYQNPLLNQISRWNYFLHTGIGNVPWALVLGLSTLGSIFLLFLGLMIAFQRLRNKVSNKFSAQKAEQVILFGSENGATKSLAIAVYKSLLAAGQKVFIDELNKYQEYPAMKSLMVLTSTYGEGIAPANADQFLGKITQHPPKQPFQYGVLGLGSLAYPDFCQFAKDAAQKLSSLPNAAESLPLKLVHNQSKTEVIDWVRAYATGLGVKVDINKYLKIKAPKLFPFEILGREIDNYQIEPTYLIRLKALRKVKFQSGDLLNFYPGQDPVKRSYSIAKDEAGNILLAIKRHEFGVVSNFLFQEAIGNKVYAKIETNPHFHLPKSTSKVILIANGTGLGPFLGMFNEVQNQKVQLYWGGKTKDNYKLYQAHIADALEKGQIQNFRKVFSREGNQDRYVQDLITKDEEQIATDLKAGAIIMICGSITMLNGVLEILNQITLAHLKQEINFFVEKGQLISDCY